MAVLFFIVFCAATFSGYFVVPLVYQQLSLYNQKRTMHYAHKLDRMMPRRQIQKVTRVYIFAPIILAAIFYFFFPSYLRLFGVVLGIVGGVIFPGIYTQILLANNKKKFAEQLVDALMIMSSSFRGGLSLIQAMESVVEEMPDPMAQEFSTVLAENNMGVSLEEALAHLYHRNPSVALQQMTTAILLARETGGNLPLIFQRIVGVMRQRKKIEGQISTLTIQGKIQGVVMSLLPLLFAFIIVGTNPHYFDYLLNTKLGQKFLIYAIVSEIIGAYMIIRICVIKDY